MKFKVFPAMSNGGDNSGLNGVILVKSRKKYTSSGNNKSGLIIVNLIVNNQSKKQKSRDRERRYKMTEIPPVYINIGENE